MKLLFPLLFSAIILLYLHLLPRWLIIPSLSLSLIPSPYYPPYLPLLLSYRLIAPCPSSL